MAKLCNYATVKLRKLRRRVPRRLRQRASWQTWATAGPRAAALRAQRSLVDAARLERYADQLRLWGQRWNARIAPDFRWSGRLLGFDVQRNAEVCVCNVV